MVMTYRAMILLGALLLAVGNKFDAPKKTHLHLTQDESKTGDWESSNRSWQQAAATYGIVVARVPSDPIDWLERLLASDVHLFIYTLPGDGEAAALAKQHEGQVTINDQVPDTSREAGEFLDFIVQTYDKLPDRVAFAQGHEGAWHDPRGDKPQTVLSLLKHDSQKMVHFPSRHVCGNMLIDHKRVSTELWARYFQKELGDYPLGWPRGYSTPCCSQFVTTRDAIRAHPVSFYKDLHKWMTSGKKDTHKKNGGTNPAYHQAQLMEAMWSYVFEHQSGKCS